MFGQQILSLYHETVDTDLRQSPFDASSREAFHAWQTRARGILGGILGQMPDEKVDLELTRETVAETTRYLHERIVYYTRPGLQVPAYLFTPKNAPLPAPAVLALHGHSHGGKDESIDPDSIYHGFARRFAEQGCVVLAPDQIGFGERKLPEGKVGYRVVTHGLNMLGHTLIGWRHWDLVRALDLLEGLDTVRPDRIGVMGLSLGGETTLITTAMAPRVHAACVCGYLTSHKSTFLDREHCTCGHLRDLARHFEHLDLAAMIAPRPLFVDTGSKDTAFLTPEAEAAVAGLRCVYDLFERPAAHLGIEVHGGAHEISCELSVPWMLARLGE